MEAIIDMDQNVKLIAMDLDGTLTQHRSLLGEENRAVLSELKQHYELLMVGAGTCRRIFDQMQQFPINIIGNYGMQESRYTDENGFELIRSEDASVDKAEVLRRSAAIRNKYALNTWAGETLEIHPTGMLTFPVLGTKAQIADKLSYDPDKSKRAVMYPFVKELFYDYNVMIGGSSSFDIVPERFGKKNALTRYMSEHGYTMDQVVYCGDDYAEGGNDHDVYAAGFRFIKVDHYQNFGRLIREAGLLGD